MAKGKLLSAAGVLLLTEGTLTEAREPGGKADRDRMSDEE
jgi:hypothetical protein